MVTGCEIVSVDKEAEKEVQSSQIQQEVFFTFMSNSKLYFNIVFVRSP